MPAHPSVIAALRAAVQASPDDTPLRLHLAQLLLEAREHADALEQFATILAREPAHLEALEGAAAAAAGAGEAARADGYRRLFQALSGMQATPSAPPPAPIAPTPEPADTEDAPSPYDWNELLRRPPSGDAVAPEPLEERAERIPAYAPEDDPDDSPFETERPTITLQDVAGMEAVKRRLNVAFLAPLRNPEFMRAYGKSLRGGLMLYGPPGCGKTYIARALAGEMGAKFLAIGLSDVLDMWLGESEKRLQQTFQAARRNAPCVLFFDEVDALGQKRSHLRHHAGRNVVAQLLSEMDNVASSNEGVFVLSATNHPWDVDTALRRPGRFDRLMLVLPPDEAARVAALTYHLQDRPAAGVDIRWIAGRTAEYSGADLAHLCESAAELAMEEALASGRTRPISTDHFKRALKEVRPSTRPWFEVARNYAMFANEGGIYDDLLEYIRFHKI